MPLSPGINTVVSSLLTILTAPSEATTNLSAFTAFYPSYDGLPPYEGQIGNPLVFSELECFYHVFETKFGERSANAAAYSPKFGICRAYHLKHIYMMPLFFFSDKNWRTIAPKQNLTLRFHWTLDKEDKGKNKGTGGADTSLDTSRMCKFETKGGPTWRDAYTRYCVLVEDDIPAKLTWPSHHAFDFMAAFTVGMWLKTKEMKKAAMIIAALPSYVPRIMFASPRYADQIAIAFGKTKTYMAVSTINKKSLHDWRYIAVVYKPPLDAKFYLNGKVWPLSRSMKRRTEEKSNKLVIGQTHYKEMILKGQMACISIFQEALGPNQVEHLMHRCP